MAAKNKKVKPSRGEMPVGRKTLKGNLTSKNWKNFGIRVCDGSVDKLMLESTLVKMSFERLGFRTVIKVAKSQCYIDSCKTLGQLLVLLASQFPYL